MKEMTSNRTTITIQIDESRKTELMNACEDGNWATLSSYCRHLLRAGESNIANLDPRNYNRNDSVNGNESGEGEICDEDLLSALINLQEDDSNDFVHVDQISKPFVEELEELLNNRLFQLSLNQGSPVQTDKKGGYRVNRHEE